MELDGTVFENFGCVNQTIDVSLYGASVVLSCGASCVKVCVRPM